MYSVFSKDVYHVDGKKYIKINSEFISKFTNENEGCFVITDFQRFKELLIPENFKGHGLSYGLVSYGSVSLELNIKMLTNDRSSALFVKDQSYEYQNEFRILMHRDLEQDNGILLGKSENELIAGDDFSIEQIGSIAEFSEIHSNTELANIPNIGHCLTLDNIA